MQHKQLPRVAPEQKLRTTWSLGQQAVNYPFKTLAQREPAIQPIAGTSVSFGVVINEAR